ncbi:MAG: pentapeptide repeat-containing protein [Chroococcidiopsidaceae cyanobacterium CP_BM_RX_35]|nr:pentapeptide repeat-containing protein [Chroococcidiopsidaceae cyanobacterium CP_BM_RX_35]
MSYCLNPSCSRPVNPDFAKQCQSCKRPLNRLRDRYRIIKALAQGGFGATFCAQDEGLPGEPTCVIKQLRPSVKTPEVMQMARELFEREAKTLGRVGNHPQVPRLLDYFEQEGQFYLVQEYVNGWTLQQEVKQSGRFSEVGVKQFLSEIVPILEYIHGQQVIHRDIKPANLIRRSQDKRLVLIDFGAVKDKVSATATNQLEQTALTSYAVGTTGFAPPEQLAMRPVYASDIYAVGVTCVYLLTGKSPKDLDYNSLTGEMLWQQEVNVSNHFEAVVRKMLEVSVRHRYQSASEVLRALELEPYTGTLTRGMATQSSIKVPTINIESDVRKPHFVELAEAIRARRAKSAAEASSFSFGTSHQSLTVKQTQSGMLKTKGSAARQSKALPKLDTDAILSAYAKGNRDFTSQDLSLLDLEQADLSSTNFHSSKLNKTNLQKANLFDSNFSHASLNQANLKQSNLSRAYLSHADLEGADLRGADLSYAYLMNANLRGTNLCGANLTGAKLSEEHLALAKTNWMTVRPSGKRSLLR